MTPKYCPRPPICTCSAWGKPFSCMPVVTHHRKNHEHGSEHGRFEAFIKVVVRIEFEEKKYVLEAVSKKLTLCLLNWKSMGSIFPWTQLPLPKPPEPQVLHLLMCGHLHFKHIGQNAHVFSLLSSKVWRTPNCRCTTSPARVSNVDIATSINFQHVAIHTVRCDKNASFKKQPDPAIRWRCLSLSWCFSTTRASDERHDPKRWFGGASLYLSNGHDFEYTPEVCWRSPLRNDGEKRLYSDYCLL